MLLLAYIFTAIILALVLWCQAEEREEFPGSHWTHFHEPSRASQWGKAILVAVALGIPWAVAFVAWQGWALF